MNEMKSRWRVRYGLTLLLAICWASLTVAQEWVGARSRVLPWSRSGVADRVRLGVRTEGLYTVTAGEVATAMGLSTAAVVNAFQTTNLTFSCQGRDVACSVTATQLFFKGESAFSRRCPENVYWLKLNTGATPLPLLPDEPPASSWSYGTQTVQGTNVATYSTQGTLTSLPSFLAYNLILSGKSNTITHAWSDGVTNLIDGVLSVTLLSASKWETTPDQHKARISVNGHIVTNEVAWENERYVTFTMPVPGHLLTNGVAAIKVENRISSGYSARFYWTKYALTIARRTDIQPLVMYPSIRGVCDADGYLADNRADYVVLIPPEGWLAGFRESLRPLVQFRERQGLRTAVLDVEALYNRFTYGLADPEAIRAFCSNAYQMPDIKLKYLLLAGAGSLDVAHERYPVTNYQSCLIPPLIAAQKFPVTGEAMIVSVDQAFGDVTGNSAPEIAVGRLPTVRTQEVAVAVAKILAYEEALPWKIKAAVSASSDFVSDMNVVKQSLETAGKQVEPCYPADSTAWKNILKPSFAAGVGTFWYIGHSSATAFGDDTATIKLLDRDTVRTNSWSCKPMAVLMGCHLNSWQTMNETNPNESLAFGPFSVFRTETGFSAVFASTGYAWQEIKPAPMGEAQFLALYLSEACGSNGVYRLGDAICSALQRLAVYNPSITPDRLQSYSLVGDPAMMWRHDYSGTGTPVSWLQTYGLTAWDGDVSDTDGDGWRAWQEYQAGTRPDTNYFHIATQALDMTAGAIGLTFETKANKRYRIMWKYALEDSTLWAPLSWALPGQLQTLRSPDEFIIPASVLSTICVPVRAEDKQGFYRIQEVE